MDVLSQDIFNWRVWPNVLDVGLEPLNIYQSQIFEFKSWKQVNGSEWQFFGFPLSHGISPVSKEKILSTAFLLHYGGAFVIYFGDTGADKLENVTYMGEVWDYVSPLIANNTLKGILIECSYSNSQPDNLLYGHLNPKWLIEELHYLNSSVSKLLPSPTRFPLENFNVIITHVKPISLLKTSSQTSLSLVQSQLDNLNDIQVRFSFPEQGSLLYL